MSAAPARRPPARRAAASAAPAVAPVPEPESDRGRVNHAGQPQVNLLIDAAIGPVRRFVPGTAGLRMAAKLARRPRVVARRTASTTAALAKVAAGRSEVAAKPKDRRFADDAWTGNPVFHRILQSYLVVGQTARDLVADAELSWGDRAQMEFVADNLIEALSPSNAPLLNPTALKAAVDTGGKNYVRGIGSFLKDMALPPRVPSMVDSSAFTVGRELAITPGAVVLRTEVFELIQYTPQTDTVHEVPMLLVPPTINKYYVADLAPGRSMVEHFVRSGQPVFLMSWRNPGKEQADWGLDTYVQAVLDALDAAEEITGADRSILFSLCAGGIISTLALGHLIHAGQEDRLAGFALGVTLLDQSHAGLMASVTNPALVAAAVAKSRWTGYLDGRSLATTFAWLRPGDLIWNYWVNNYLLGKKPPAFDILFWNADTTRLAARLHEDFLNLGLSNGLIKPGGTSVLGSPVDLSQSTVDSYIVAGIADHICAWQSCYRSVHLLGGDSRFVLSTSGHIAALVNPPGSPKASFRLNPDNPETAEEFLAGASTVQGTWWDDFVPWLTERSGAEVAAPQELGSAAYEPVADAPGSYVFAT